MKDVDWQLQVDLSGNDLQGNKGEASYQTTDQNVKMEDLFLSKFLFECLVLLLKPLEKLSGLLVVEQICAGFHRVGLVCQHDTN